MHNESMCYRVDFVPAGKDRLLSKQPCEVAYAYTSLPTTGSDVVIYDGIDADGDKKIDMAAGQGAERQVSPMIPLYFKRGLFVSAPSGGGGVTVQWRELTETDHPGPDAVVVVGAAVATSPYQGTTGMP